MRRIPNARCLHRCIGLRGDYILIAKDNHPTLNEDFADLFEDHTPDRRRWKQAQTWDKAHGRVEHRQITCSPDLNDWFGKDWESIKQVFQLVQAVRILKTNQIRHGVVYGLSSLSLEASFTLAHAATRQRSLCY